MDRSFKNLREENMNNNLSEKIADASKTIFTYCMARTSNREDAEDLSQEILYELLKSAGNLRDEGAFYGFMWAVAGNVYKQWYRKKKLRNECELTDEITPAEEDRYFAEEEDGEEIALLRRELCLLNEQHRRAVILYYTERNTCAEIAEKLSVSESMVKYLLFRSRKILKEGMNMERKLGELSYNPKSLTPMYSGEGTNYFSDFMKGKIRQNIAGACYNAALTPEQISLETGIPLPYLDDEIAAMENRKILVKDGPRYTTNVIIITSECFDELEKSAEKYHGILADRIGGFIDGNLEKFRALGYTGSDFSDNSVKWQMAAWIFRTMLRIKMPSSEAPITGWGEHAYLYLMEQMKQEKALFNYCDVDGDQGDRIKFLDYLPKPTCDHHDFYGNQRYINILCDIAAGRAGDFSRYDMDAVDFMLRRGYVIRKDGRHSSAAPVYTQEQAAAAQKMADDFIHGTIMGILADMNAEAEKILSEHTPKHLQDQVKTIAAADIYFSGICAPAAEMIRRGCLSTDWTENEMPSMYVCLNR